MYDVQDLRPTTLPKSDQLNAEQLLTGPVTLRVTEVRTSTSAEQPVEIHYQGEDGRPYKPCKTMRKLLVFAWGIDGSKWAGRALTVFNDPAVRFGGQEVGGIRISHLSDIDGDIRISLTSTRGKKSIHEVKLLRSADAARLDRIKAAATTEALKAEFAAAYKSTTDAAVRADFKKAYDAALSALTALAAQQQKEQA